MMSPLARKQASSQTKTSTELCSDFLLPSWFLSNNVKTTAELNDLPLPCRLVFRNANNVLDKHKAPKPAYSIPLEQDLQKTLGTCKQESPDAASDSSEQDAGETNEADTLDQEVDILEYQLSHHSFSELRDVTAAFLMRDQEGKLSPSHAAVLLCSSWDLDLPFVDGVILHLAKDLQAILVSVDLEDLEDLGWDFNHQEQRMIAENKLPESQSKKEPNQDYFAGMAVRYFGTQPEQHASKDAWNRTEQAIAAILDTQIPKSRPNTARENGPEAAAVISPETEPPPLLLYLRDSSEMIQKEPYILERFRDCIRDQLLSGRGIVLLVSFSGNGSLPKVGGKISAGSASIVTMTPFCFQGKVDLTGSYCTSIINTRRLKRFLRFRIPHLFVPEVLEMFQPYSAWDLDDDGRYEFVEASQWKERDFQRAITQITGRAFGMSHIDLEDVRIVLLRLDLLKTVRQTEESDEREELSETEKPKEADESNEGAPETSVEMGTTNKIMSDTNEISETKAERWVHKLRRVESAADPLEKLLISCIINPDHIDCTYDDVIVDENTKETVRHLVSLSNFHPQVASSCLLKHIRINGALFYGPPGTGKTHLCRAIAKASGASMLAIDSAAVHSKYVSETERLIKAAFKLSKAMFPCVLFIDEADSLFYRRSSSDKSCYRTALTQFLIEMDGLSKSDTAPFVVVATNHPRDLDEAFFRQLPQKIFFGLPGEESRSKILRLFLKDEDLDPLVDINALARQTDGYSGSDLRSFCAEAALIRAIEQVKEMSNGVKMSKLRLTVSHFAKSLKKIRPSVSEKTLRDLSEFSRRFGEAHCDDASKDIGSTLPESMLPALNNSAKQSNSFMPGLSLVEDQKMTEREVVDGGPTRSKQKPDSNAVPSCSVADAPTEAPNPMIGRRPNGSLSKKRKRDELE
ncbi:ATPase family AAA domain-containing protein 1-A [Metarhizium anisopliae]|nr:ATPase family AAA domain-containing protein 1-A [Metarhizium anisopliae]